MPIYEYECQACHQRHEALQKISDAPLKDCVHCGKPELKKLVSAAGFRLKGSGWYETDFKGDKRRNVAESGDKPAAEGAGDKGSADKAATDSSANSSDSSKSTDSKSASGSTPAAA